MKRLKSWADETKVRRAKAMARYSLHSRIGTPA